MIDLHSHFVPTAALQAVTRASELPRYDPDTRVVEFPSGGSRPVGSPLCDLTARTTWIEERGIHLQVLSPWTDLIGDDLERDPARRWAQLLNDATSDEVGAVDTYRLFAMLPACPEAAASELERCVALPGFVGGALPTQFAGADLDTAGLDELFATAVHLDVPLFVHPGRVMAQDRMSRFFLNNICGYPFETTLAALRLYFSGTFERHPDLRLLLAHCGGTLPMLAGRAAHTVGNVPSVPGDAATPSDILNCFFFDTVVHDPTALAFAIQRVGADRVVIGTDAPFPMSIDRPAKHLQAAFRWWPPAAGHPPTVGDLDLSSARILNL